MTQEEIIEMGQKANLAAFVYPHLINEKEWAQLKDFIELVAAKEREFYMQLFLDPENQPTQFGTATQEYREQEIAEVRDLLFALAHRIRTTHLYGMEVQKMLEQAEAIRARGEA